LILLIILSVLISNGFAQEYTKSLILAKQRSGKIKAIESTSYFKIKSTDGEKQKGRFAEIGSDYFISEGNDTIFFEDVVWIKAKTELTKWGTAAAITATFAGIWFSIGAIPAAMYFIAIEGAAIVLLATAATISSTVVGFRMLGGRKYQMNRWNLDGQ
jgi:hypothetical protein